MAPAERASTDINLTETNNQCDDWAGYFSGASLTILVFFEKRELWNNTESRFSCTVIFLQCSKYYDSQWAKTLLNDIFELSQPTVSDLGYITILRLVWVPIWFFSMLEQLRLDVTLASYGILEDLVLRARGVSSLSGCVKVGRSLFPSLFGSTVADSVASQSKVSVPFVSGFTATDAGVESVHPGGMSSQWLPIGHKYSNQKIFQYWVGSRRYAFRCVVVEFEVDRIQDARSIQVFRWRSLKTKSLQ